ncbi:MAG TPA: o-succinylbenzoate synthase [Aggregatilineales bacterium]|nr:o-succinylbenzoate synthase [Aggregatilineales bacterium]
MRPFDNLPPIQSIALHPIAMPIVEKLVTSFGGDDLRPAILVELNLGGVTGWGECVAAWAPGYSYETIGTAMHILGDFMAPAVIGKTNLDALDRFRGHPMARMAIEAAFWTAVASLRGVPVGDLMGTDRKSRVLVGVSIGIQPSVDATLDVVGKRINEGYRRIKLKIKPGWDVQMLRAVRAAYPDIMLMADANGAYTLNDAPLLKSLDDLNLLMLEQPLGHDDIYQHSVLQPQLRTPICLDESIRNVDDVRLAIQIGAGKIINLKPARVGGITESLKIHAFCLENGIPLWNGGMLETGVGRALNLAMASLPGFTLPSDISATDRYYNPDLTDETFVLNRDDSTITVPTAPGLGVHIDADRLTTAEADYRRISKLAYHHV